MPFRPKYWNHNTAFHGLLLQQVPRSSRGALDVGSGDGRWAAQLARRCDLVVALERDPDQVAEASTRCATVQQVSVVRGDLMAHPLQREAFDVVTVLTALHHMPLEPALTAVVDLLRPGGRAIVLGIWTGTGARDLPWNAASVGVNTLLRQLWGRDEMTAPQKQPEESLEEVRHALPGVLPGARVRRLPLWRYLVVWDKPLATR